MGCFSVGPLRMAQGCLVLHPPAKTPISWLDQEVAPNRLAAPGHEQRSALGSYSRQWLGMAWGLASLLLAVAQPWVTERTPLPNSCLILLWPAKLLPLPRMGLPWRC